jgi:DDE superfamily endonuclease
VYLFGAACPARGTAVGWIMPTCNTDCMNLHLAEISRAVAADVQVVLLLDNAGWHAGKGLKVPDNISLAPLPPYSPELNAMEPAWLFLKSHYLSNRAYADHDALYAAGCDAWNRFAADSERVKTVCAAAWTESALSN